MKKPSQHPLIGKRILDFDVVETLGQGGMGAVLKGKHYLTGQLVAIKVLPPDKDDYPDEVRKRFLTEAQALALVEHPNIVALNNFTEDERGNLCLVMQFIEGPTMADLIDEKKITPREAVRIVLETLKALEFAHGQGVIHRDIKPGNIIIRPDGAVKVTDFGIARIAGAPGITQAGYTMGTAVYMAPEQIDGRAMDARADLYGLGVTLFEGVTGAPPFDGKTRAEVLRKHLETPPPAPRSINLELSADLENVVLTALRKGKDDRFATADAFARALRATPEGEGERSMMFRLDVAEVKKRSQKVIMAAIVGMVTLAVFSGVSLWLLLHRH